MIKALLLRIIDSIKKLRQGESLKLKAARGGVWLGAANGVEQGLRLLRNMILTRLLAPETFGVMAIVLAINAAFESFTEIGIQTAIIQNPKGRERTYLNGAWWLSMVRAVGLYTLAYIGAPWIAQFYSNPELLPLLRIAFLGVLFNGAMSPGIHVAIKQMNFKHWAIAYHGGGAIGILSAVLLALAMRDIWALVLGFTIEAASRCMLSYFVCPYRPGLSFNKDHLQGLFKYSRGIFGLPILTFIFMRTDIFVIGKLCSPSELGLYSMAAAFSQMPFQFVGKIISSIAMPAFSEMQTDKARINTTILEVTAMITSLGFPLLLYAILYGRDLLLLIYGSQYAKAAGPFAIIWGTALLQIICIPVVTYYFTIGAPQLHRRFAAIRTLLIVALIYPAVKNFGLVGAAAAGLIAMALSILLQVIRMREITHFDLRKYGATFLRALRTSLSVAAFWLITRHLCPSQPLLSVFFGAMGCLLAYALSIMVSLRSHGKGSILFMASHEKQA